MEKLPEDAIVLGVGAFTFFEKEENSMETKFFIQRLKQHVAINLESLYTDDDVTLLEFQDCIAQLQNLLKSFKNYADNDDVDGIKALLKEVGFSDAENED